ncbi:MAG: transposase, partial [Elainellaceae cyanobacterium]
MSVCRGVWNFARRERKDWLASRRCPINACSLRGEYILPADEPFPGYHVQAKRLTQAKKQFPALKTVNAQMLQQVLRKLETAWEAWWLKRAGLPRFKKQNRMRSFAFPQMLKRCISRDGIKLPQLGWVKVRWSREIPELFTRPLARIEIMVCNRTIYQVHHGLR